MDFKNKLSKIIESQINQPINLELPPNLEFGDFALHSYKLKLPPNELKNKLKLPNFIEKTEIKGPYLNFFIKKPIYIKNIIQTILKQKEKYASEKLKKQTIVLDYSSPNIAKPFSIALLRTTALGHSLAKISKKLGYKTISINHLGDWGTQFGKVIYAFKTWGNEKELKAEPIEYLLKLYVKFHEEAEKDPKLEDEARAWFLKLEKGDQSAKKLWKTFVDLSLNEFEKTYKRLGIEFDHYWGESFYSPFIKSTLKLLEEKKLLEEDQGAMVVKLDQFGMPPSILKKSDDASIYATRDLAAAIYRYKRFKYSKSIYITDTRQQLHFKQFFKVLELAGFEWAKNLVHVTFGTMNFGNDIMSTRAGKVIFMNDVLDQAESKILNIIKEKNQDLKNKEKVAEIVGIGSIMFWVLGHDRVHDIDFSWNNVLDLQGETGPYLQYTYARASSILDSQTIPKSINYKTLTTPQELNLINHLNQYNIAINQSFNNYKPSILGTYLIRLAQLFNEFYSACPVLKADEKTKNARLSLVKATSLVLENGLSLLGMHAPKEM